MEKQLDFEKNQLDLSLYEEFLKKNFIKYQQISFHITKIIGNIN